MLGENEQPQLNLAGLDRMSGHRRSRIILLLALLLAATVAVAVKYRAYWLDSAVYEQPADAQLAADAAKEAERHTRPVHSKKAGAKGMSMSAAAATAAEATAAEVTEPSRPHETVIPPLRVDVRYASGVHRTLLARNSAVHVDMDRDTADSPALPTPEAGALKPSETVTFSPQTVEVVVRPVEPVYPPLAQQSNVQGSVVLRARINEAGTVQSLQVISGPDILTTAALEAVRQWRFKPHYEAGVPVPTETQITVNFTISTP